MWDWLKRMKGQRLEWQTLRLWHTVEKDQDERLLSKKVSFLLGKLRTAMMLEVQEARGMFPDPDYDRGVIYISSATAPSGVERVFQIPRGSKVWEVVDQGWQLTGLDTSKEETNHVNWLGTVNGMSL